MVDIKTTPTLQPGDVADLWHAGTRKYYRVTVQHQVTEEEANGPDFENLPPLGKPDSLETHSVESINTYIVGTLVWGPQGQLQRGGVI